MSLKLLQKKLRENFPIYGSFIYGSTWYMHYSRGTKTRKLQPIQHRVLPHFQMSTIEF